MTFSPGLTSEVTSSVRYWTVSLYSVKPGFSRPFGSVLVPLSVISFQPRPDEYTRALVTTPCWDTGETLNALRSMTDGRTGLHVPALGEPATGRHTSGGTGPVAPAPEACAADSGAVRVRPVPGVVIAAPAAAADVSAGVMTM